MSYVGGLAESDYINSQLEKMVQELRVKHKIKGKFENVVNLEKSLAIIKGG